MTVEWKNVVAGATGALQVTHSTGQIELDIVTAVLPQKSAANTFTGLNIFDGGLRITTGAGAPLATDCDASGEVGRIYARNNAQAANATLYICSQTGVGTYAWELVQAARYGAVEFTLDGGGAAITTGAKGWIRVPYAGTITSHELTCDQSGSVVLDLWKDAYANFPPTVADTITASAKPTLSSQQKTQDTTLTGWTTSIAAGEYIRINVDSASTVTYCVLSLQVTRSS